MYWLFGWKACEIIAPGPGIKQTHPALKGEVLATGLPGRSQGRKDVFKEEQSNIFL